MMSEKVEKIARWCSSDEVQKWSAGIGWFAADALRAITPTMKAACRTCPISNIVNAGGCLKEDCPIHQVMFAVRRASPRAVKATREIYKAKYK